jgi:hypothetical protein
MPTVYRVSAVWTGFTGGPGISRFAFLDLTDDTKRNAAAASVRTLFDSIKVHLPTGTTVQVQSTVLENDAQTGVLTGETAIAVVPAVVSGTGAAAYAAGAGYFIGWKTGVIFNGRRVQGRTFIVPAAGCFETNGSLGSADLTTAQAAATAMITTVGTQFAIWARQMTDPPPPAKPVQINGTIAEVTAALVKDQASSLRTRRTV